MKSLLIASSVFGVISLTSLGYGYWAHSPIPAQPIPSPIPPAVHLVEATKDFGVVGLNEELRGSFTVVNDTPETIYLNEPMKSCSCTSAVLDRRELVPGEQCSLTYAIRTGSRRVPRVESIALIYTRQDGQSRQLFGRIYFIPKGVFEVEPDKVELTKTQPKATFVVRGDPGSERHEVLAVQSRHRCVKVDTSALPTVTLELDLTTPDEAIVNTECVVTTNNPAEETIRVPVRVRKE